ncbi:hypothetical protein Sputw3181_2881 [Shewanella sp. W3-18-1]|uniref:phage tail-collar fiber domain-containing protein n=1 Tax=Shewanella sp. (strain W3-18-1) TaxID=351745 RepID=UPI00005FDAFE|nr:phage tail protein [Shewanella sp. W3-18-1]ABM25698.1 hypothetical protein Sputw3181_2881 [Shewanella sp. W3-18-1]
MSQVITLAGERLFALKAQNNQQLDIDTFIFAYVPGQDSTAPIDRNEGLPPIGQRVHTQIVQQTGLINENAVVYSSVLDSLTGPFDFNWVGLYSSVNQTLIAIIHTPTVSKTVTVPGAAGNILNRNFVIEYSGIAELTGITVDAETWQLDYTARLNGMDELTRQLAADMNGKDWFIDDGFKVEPRSTLNTFKVAAGAGYVSGLRVTLAADHILTLSSYPQFVYVDAWFDGTSESIWKGHVAFTVTTTEMDDYIDVNGRNHYVFKLARITAADVVEDLRNIEGLKEQIEYINEITLAKRMSMANAKKNKFKNGDKVFITDFGYLYSYKESRFIIEGQSQSEMTYDDNMHILVNAGGMLQFDDWGKVKNTQSVNAAKFAGKLKDRTSGVTVDCYGDSITFGQALPNTANATNKIGAQTGFGDGSSYNHWQFNNNYPQWIASFFAENIYQYSAVNNFGYSGDRTITGYLRHRAVSGSDAATIMYGVNDCLFATSNGSQPSGLTSTGMYNVGNYSVALRLFVAKQILQGKSVTVLGTAPFASLVGFDGSQLAASKLARAYNAAAKKVALELGCRFIDVCQDILNQYGIMEITQEGTHLSADGLKIAGSRIAAALVTVETENRVTNGSVLIANPNIACVLSKSSGNLLPNDTSTTPRGTIDNKRTTLNVEANWITIPFFAETDSLVMFINGSCAASGAVFEIILDSGALQSDFHYQRVNFSGKPTASKEIAKSGKFNRENTNISDDTQPFFVVANRGWHSLSIRKNSGDSSVLFDSITFESLASVLASDASGVTASCSVSNGALGAGASNITSVSEDYPGEFLITFTNSMANNKYTVAIDVNETDADPVAITTRYKTVGTVGMAFNKWNGTAWVKFKPTMFTVQVIGGR